MMNHGHEMITMILQLYQTSDEFLNFTELQMILQLYQNSNDFTTLLNFRWFYNFTELQMILQL